ncbi:aldose epimerase family protein [Caballeronia ptereochthonis]|uniref:Aldose 1-epimerase n=1 Tax=Caballeronia ptereochthonis TaxID=1777144 RepID=A0A158D4R5_9BURK|nr:aldose epimerase [Caballeronia ptereochthonis]SAK89453.1 aldose 1-epimerase [Caballeronia ptereochthonis]
MTKIREVVELQAEPRIRISSGPHVIEIASQAGGRITRFATQDERGLQEWLAPVTAASWPCDAWPKGGSYPLVPFSNRVRDSRFPAPDGTIVELAAFPGMAHALHGIGQFAAWSVELQEADCVVLRYAHREGEHGWPWAFEAVQLIEANADGARLSMRIANRSSRPMPVGLGFHPYFNALEAELEATTLWRHEAEVAIEPATERPARRHVREAEGYTRYLSGWDGRATLRYAAGRTLDLSADGALSHVVVHCPAGAGYLCVEPVSHVSDGFNLASRGVPGTGIAVTEPGSEIRASLVMAAGANPAPRDDGGV